MKKIIFLLIIFISSITLVNAKSCTIVSGTGKTIGDEIACGSEHFYVVSNDGTNLKMLSKYNLLTGDTYYKISLPENTTNLDDFSLSKEYQNKIIEGYDVYDYKRIYNPDLEKYVYTSVIFYKTATKEKSDYEYIFYNEPQKIEDILRDTRVKEYFSKGYTYNLYMLSTNEYYGIKFYKESNKNYNIVIFDTSVETKYEALRHSNAQEKLLNNYFSSYIYDSENKIIGLNLYQQEGYEFKTIVFDSEVDPPFVLKEQKVAEELANDNWGIYSTYDGEIEYDDMFETTKKYIGITLYKMEGYEFETIQSPYEYVNGASDEPYTTYKLIYNDEKVLSLLNEGFIPHEKKYWSYNRYVDEPKEYAIYGLTYRKDDAFDYYNVMFGKEISADNKENYVNSLEEVIEKKEEGYVISQYYSIDYQTTLSYSTYYETYVGVQMRKAKNTSSSSTSSNSTSNESYTKVYQDESAIGAHGDEKGNPELIEVGVISNTSLTGPFSEDSPEYSVGFRDYTYSESSYGYEQLDNYKKTLQEEGFPIKDVTSITVSEINEIVYNIKGEYLPLQQWYENTGEIAYDNIHNTSFLILGSIKDQLPEEYSWIWSTTYWTRTADPAWSNVYFIDTLGDLCSSEYCSGVIGAGIRPLVTISSEDIIYNVKTKTDGNGKVEATHDSAKSGDEVKFTIEPERGYKLKEIKVTDYEGNVIIFTENTFIMPTSNVLIEATFEITNPNTISLSIIAALMFSILSIIIVKVNYPKMKWLNE